MEYTISNGQIEIRVSSFGAELRSLRDVSTGQEYMWRADPAYWKRTSPVLFPLVGNYRDKQSVYEGKTYTMSQHGFARDMEFTCTRETADELWFALSASPETREKWPFDFILELGYVLRERTVEVFWRVKNTDSRTMYFSIGGHPAFNCPPEGQGSKEGYLVKFDAQQLISRRINDSGLATDELDEYGLVDGCLPVTEELFANDALVIEDGQTHEVSLAAPDGKVYVTVRFDAPLVGIWSPPGKAAPFICIEPWYGRCDHQDFAGDLTQREWGNELEAGATFEASWQVTV